MKCGFALLLFFVSSVFLPAQEPDISSALAEYQRLANIFKLLRIETGNYTDTFDQLPSIVLQLQENSKSQRNTIEEQDKEIANLNLSLTKATVYSNSLEENLNLSESASLSLSVSLRKARQSLTELQFKKIRDQVITALSAAAGGFVLGLLVR